VDVVNLDADEWDRTEEREGWRSKDAWIGARLNAELIGGSLYELEPGHKLWPYHTHHANEEWLLVVRGRPTLRTADGEQDLREAMSSASGGEGTASTRSATAPTRRSASS
jgi:uncharacterized cupin superfamily protein